MREPGFWRRRASVLSVALSPIAAIYGAISGLRMARQGVIAGVPVICVGNYHVGGAGKTPTVLALVDLLRGVGEVPVVLSRGYGGRLKGPVAVDTARHSAQDVGDEPLMMAAGVPVVVARDRVGGAVLARSRGASVIVMDDGFQNPSLAKTISLVVIDASRGVGNGRILPAGPLRAPLQTQIACTDALLVIGEGDAAHHIVSALGARQMPVFRAHLVPDAQSAAALRDCPVLAFAGIGDPHKFFHTLRAAGVDIVREYAFADHHEYAADEIANLRAEALAQSLMLVTTQKDAARLGDLANGIAPFPVTLAFDDVDGMRGYLIGKLEHARAGGAPGADEGMIQKSGVSVF